MRQIKFRVYNKDWKMMVLPEDIYHIAFDGVTNCACDVKFNVTTTDGERHDNYWEDDGNGDNFVFMQFTGLLDKNGKEIYEGDILEHKNIGRYVVSFRFGSFVTQRDGTGKPVRIGLLDLDDYEVIGNIYENSELLK